MRGSEEAGNPVVTGLFWLLAAGASVVILIRMAQTCSRLMVVANPGANLNRVADASLPGLRAALDKEREARLEAENRPDPNDGQHPHGA